MSRHVPIQHYRDNGHVVHVGHSGLYPHASFGRRRPRSWRVRVEEAVMCAGFLLALAASTAVAIGLIVAFAIGLYLGVLFAAAALHHAFGIGGS